MINTYIYSCLVHTKKHLTKQTECKQVHNYSTRSNHCIYRSQCRLSKTLHSYNTIGIRIFNKLPSAAHNVDIERFKKVMNLWLLTNPMYELREVFDANLDDLLF